MQLSVLQSNAIAAINAAIDGGNSDELIASLQADHALVNYVTPKFGAQYLAALKVEKATAEQSLSRAEIQTTVDETNTLVTFCNGVLQQDFAAFLNLLSANQKALHLPELDSSAYELYHAALSAAIQANGGNPVCRSQCRLFCLLSCC